MTDRNVQWPNRYQLTKVEGTDDIYDLTPAPGTITAEGTMINKASLLTDETAQAYGFTEEELADVVPDDVLAAIKPLIDAAQNAADNSAIVVYGTYTGTGAYGIGSPNTLNFEHIPIFVFIRAQDYNDVSMIFAEMNRGSQYYYPVPGINNYQNAVTWGENSVSWYGSSAVHQNNLSNNVYFYMAILKKGEIT